MASLYPFQVAAPTKRPNDRTAVRPQTAEFVQLFSVDSAQSVEDLTAAMKGVRQPLVDVENSGIQLIRISGHSTNDCFESEDRVLCGFADLFAADDGRLPIELDCNCATSPFVLCP